MRHFLLLFLAVSQFFLSFAQGPDQFGYTFLTSNDSLGPTYQWFDITSTGGKIHGLGDDNFSLPIPISSFKFYAYQPTFLYVGSNGYVAFNPVNIASTGAGFPAIPSPGKPNGFIAPLLCDLTFSGNNNPAEVYYYDQGDTICISFLKVPFWLSNAQGYGGDNSFQVILNKADNSITFNYRVQNGSPHPAYTSNAVSIGIENASGTDGLQYIRGNTFPTQYLSVKYYYPKNPKSITDVELNWINNSENGGEFVEVNDSISPTVNVRNIGNTNIDSSFTISYQFRDSSNSVLRSGNIVIDSLPAGSDSTKQFPAFSPPFPGRFSISAQLNGIPKDSIPSNDSKEILIVALDTFRHMQKLTYASRYLSGGISWIGGNAGVGVYIKPPYYPARIDVVNFYIQQFGQANGFKWTLYDDSGRYNSLGNVLDSNTVNIMQLAPNSFYGDTIKNKNIIINSGGVYLSWVMDGDGIRLGTAMPINNPASRRTYEVIDGLWTPYRYNNGEDFMLDIDISDPTIADVELRWVNNPDNAADFIEVTDSISPMVNVKNIGSSNIDASFSIVYEYKDSSNLILQSGSILMDSLSIGVDSTKQLPSFSPPYPGRFTIAAKATGVAKDAIPSNNSKEVLIVALDTFRYMQPLNYSSKQPSSSINWPNGNSGVGVYLKPPYYPARIDIVNFFIQNIGPANGFRWTLYDDSGPDNGPGNVLYSNNINRGQFMQNAYFGDTIKNRNILINNGGVYLAWIMDGNGISLGTSKPTNRPTSRRTYEVIYGLWAPYRNIDIEDFLMHINISDPTITTVEKQIMKTDKFFVYPNPSEYSTEIVFDKNKLNWKNIKVYDLSGRRHFPRIEETENGLRLYKEMMSSGIYIIQIDELRSKLIFTD